MGMLLKVDAIEHGREGDHPILKTRYINIYDIDEISENREQSGSEAGGKTQEKNKGLFIYLKHGANSEERTQDNSYLGTHNAVYYKVDGMTISELTQKIDEMFEDNLRMTGVPKPEPKPVKAEAEAEAE